ncbi:protein BANP-like isoform X2 [Eriocheir sinensis]|uniref:protein BANP-like isoform X2 n=1 Tax=Eriocheir sinensis TaxID=95602 RepID=UPI0021C99E78|nr:protein BANP-like isoform X2 [Eriocheir sinensis]
MHQREATPTYIKLERRVGIMGEESEEECDPPSSLPPVKRVRLTQTDLLNLLLNEVTEIRTCMNTRLTLLETKVSVLVHTCNKISSRLDTMEHLATTTSTAATASSSSSSSTTSASTANSTSASGNAKQNDQSVSMEMGMELPSGGNTPILVQDTEASAHMNVISLNSEDDFPHGSWLGDPSQPTLRVRCPITPQNLLHINSTCITAEKMALTLLDYLFTKDELATSNLSGRSRWNKRQLDPLMMFGIRCHLQYKFNISSKLWHKICQNMDSKCRSAWKRRIRGMVTQPKQRQAPQIGHTSSVRKDPAVTEDISFDFDSLQNSNLDLSDVKVITQSPTCELRILSATPEQISQLQDTQEIILSEEQILAPPSSEKSILISNSSPSVSIGGEGLGGELDIGQTPTLASIDHSDHRITLKTEPGLAILDQHGILARDSETDD